MTVEINLDKLDLAFKIVSNRAREDILYLDIQTGSIFIEVQDSIYYFAIDNIKEESCIPKDVLNDFRSGEFNNQSSLELPEYESRNTAPEVINYRMISWLHSQGIYSGLQVYKGQ
ncbi:hypothetical protein H1P_1680001 [Hyella patelloides LEGE 07179]|uniref:Uncharacterized protein n=1 Tax=Hyella patelloides LEGE 07179 TaxID=945734 RepID=A0A563VN87_9CYAN|nr:hypothetical protein [Hyella patelloides]VEP12827.1 hypothetical protein H1P_1680001 [Hyella patelloides LEGE 07179]